MSLERPRTIMEAGVKDGESSWRFGKRRPGYVGRKYAGVRWTTTRILTYSLRKVKRLQSVLRRMS